MPVALAVADSALIARHTRLPDALRAAYGDDLSIPLRADRPTVIVNFVATLDGIVSFNTPGAAGGGAISGYFEADRVVMGLLRSYADVVLVGAGTVRRAGAAWTPAAVYPASAPDYAHVRRALRLAPQPTTAVVSASGPIDPRHPGLSDPEVPVLLISGHDGHRIDGDEILGRLAEAGARLVLCEGGPHLLATLFRARLVDELFLTLAPQVAGRAPSAPRLSLVEGVAFTVDAAPWATLVDVRRVGDHLFLRYRFGEDQTT